MLRVIRGAALSSLLVGTLVFAVVGTSASPASAAPARITGLSVQGQHWVSRSIGIAWNAVAGSTYLVKWSTSSHFTGATYANVAGRTATLTGLHPGTPYYVVVAAKAKGVQGPWSATSTVSLSPGYVGLFPSVSVSPATNGVTLSWGDAPYATDYSTVWSAGPDPTRTPDRWPQHTSAWFSAFAPVTKSRTFAGTDADLTKVAYGNPIYARVQAKSTVKPSAHLRVSTQKAAWPIPTKPDARALPVHFGSYNVECSGCEPAGAATYTSRRSALAANIAKQNLDVLAVVEASGPSSSAPKSEPVYDDLDARLPSLTLTDSDPAPNTANQGNRILYNPAKYTLLKTGWLTGIRDYSKTGTSFLNTPWAELQAKDAGKTTFLVVGAHFSIPTTSNKNTRKTLLGQNSTQLIASLAAVNQAHLPVVLGGDFNDNRYPEGRTDGAQPTLVRAGHFYDSSASVSRVGTNRSTYNNHRSPSQQPVDPAGDGQRIDYILTQGFQGSDQFVNVWNPGGTVIPSDHNLITARLHVPDVTN